MNRATQKSNSNLSDLERAKTFLLLLQSTLRFHPKESSFYYRPDKMLSPLRDQFEMEKSFEILNKESSGNIQAKYETVTIYSEATQQKLGFSQDIFIRIKDTKKFKDDCKKILSKKESDEIKYINKLEIIESDQDDKLKVFINSDYTNTKITPDKNDKYWDALLEIMRNKQINNAKARGIVNFFNTQKKNMLYSRSKYSLSEILKKEGDTISACIPIKPITEKTISRKTKNSLL